MRLYVKQKLGFTLLELLIVLVLIGLVASLVFPRLDRVWQSFNESSQLDDISNQIATLGQRVRLNHQEFSLDKQPVSDSLLNIPDGWIIETSKIIYYRANGVCSGGDLILTSARNQYFFELQAPFCKPVQRFNIQ